MKTDETDQQRELEERSSGGGEEGTDTKRGEAGERWHRDTEQIVLILLSPRLPSVGPFLSKTLP